MSAARFQTVLHHLRRAASGSAQGVSDADLLARYAAVRDEAAFELLVWRHGATVWALCRRLVRDEEDAHDAFQAAFLALGRSAGAVGKRGSVGGWLYRVASRAALAARARSARRAAREQPLGTLAVADPCPDPQRVAASVELGQALEEELALLPERYRLPLLLCAFAGKSNAEAACELGCPLGTIESRLTRARQRLRVRLAQRGFSLAAAAALAQPPPGNAAAPPVSLVAIAVQAASRGGPQSIPTSVAALAGEALRIPLMSKLKVATVIALVCTGLAIWAAFPAPGGGAVAPTRQRASLVPGKGRALRLAPGESAQLGLRVGQVPRPAALPPRRLALTATLAVDADRHVWIGSRFAGEILEIGKSPEGDGRLLRFGDKVARGQLLAVIWSKDLGEKKAALADALAKLHLARERLQKLEAAYANGAIPEATFREGQRAVQAEQLVVQAGERSLRLWRVMEQEIAQFRREAEALAEKPGKRPPELEKSWARVEIRSPIAGTILERNAHVGDMVTPDGHALFAVADLSRLQVQARVPESELPLLRALKPEARRWEVRVLADPEVEGIEGRIDRIAPTLDPGDKTALVVGLIPNQAGKLLVGQFVKVTILIPRATRYFAIPTGALVEEGGQTFVFVQLDPKQDVYQQRRVVVVRRGQDMAHVRIAPTPEQRQQGIDGVRPGERIIIAGAVELQGLLEALKTHPK
jgi:cobalt-zinc-cadmium efflux system membrane fusion protein